MIRGPRYVELTVADWPSAVHWYGQVLGLRLEVRDEAHRYALFRGDAVGLALKEGTPHPGTTLLTFEVEDLPATVDRLTALGVCWDGPIKSSPEGYHRIRFRDPDGHLLALFAWLRPAP